MPRAKEGKWVGAASHIQAPRRLSTPRQALHPSYSHSYLLGGLGWWILQVSDPAAPYLDGLAQEWRAPLGVEDVCRHGGWLCPSLFSHPLAAWRKQGSCRVMQRAPGYTEGGGVEGSGCRCLGGAFSRLPATPFSLDPCQIFLIQEKVGPVGRQAPPTVPPARGASPELLARGEARLRQLPPQLCLGRGPRPSPVVFDVRVSEWALDLGQGGACAGQGRGSGEARGGPQLLSLLHPTGDIPGKGQNYFVSARDGEKGYSYH